MIAPIATPLSLLSSLSLALFSVEDPVRASLQATADHFSNFVSCSNVVVALGVALEAVEIAYAVFAWRKRKRREEREGIALQELAEIFPCGKATRETELHSDEPNWIKLLLRIGIILVVIGVVGEWRFGVKLEEAHNSIHKYDVRKLTEADQKAGEAAASATIAHDEADEVKTETDELTGRLGDAAKQLGRLEGDIRVQSPRSRLIDKAAPEITKQLIPFAGQKVDLVICQAPNKPRSSQDEEMINTWGSIARILEGTTPQNKGAQWSVLNGGMTSWLGTLGCAGISVFVSSEAPENTMKAAKALGGALAKVLPPSPNKMPRIIDADFSRMTIKSDFESADAPWRRVTTHPDEITVWIGPHP